MTRSLVRVGFAAVITGGLATLATFEAAASGFSVARFGGEHGHPTTTNATAIYYNPAGIAFSEGTHVFVDALVAWRRVTYTRDASDTQPVPEGGEGANEGEASLFNILPSPAVGATTRAGDFAFGLGFFTPFGGQSSWKENERFEGNQEFPGAVDGVQRWYSIAGVLRSSYGSLAAAWRIPDTGLAIGGSLNLIVSQVDTLRARQPSGTDSLTSEGRSHLDVDGVDWSFGAGVMYEAIPDSLWVGASYQSKPNVSGGMVLEGRLENFFSGSSSDDEVELHQDLPDVVRLGATFSPVPGIELRLSGDYTRWSVFERQCLSRAGSPCEVNPDGLAAPGSTVLQNQPRDWHDTFGVRAGGSYWLNRELELFGGLGFASNAVPDETLEPALPDWNGISLGFGGRIQVADNVHVAASYTQIIYVPRDNTGKSRLNQFQGPSRGPTAGGNYGQQLGFVDANVDVEF
jgi:long-chain fatty acid transport protein